MKEESWNCRKCGITIGGHNQYLHDGMCDDCFFREYFPEDQAAYEKRVIQGKTTVIDPVGLTQKEFEKELGLTLYVETKDGKEDQAYMDAFFAFLESTGFPEITTYRMYDREIVGVLDLSMEQVKEGLYALNQKKGPFHDEDINVTQGFTDRKTFFAIVREGIIFFSGNESSTQSMQKTLKEMNIDFYLEPIKTPTD